MATEIESSGLPVSVDSATPTGSEEQTAVWPLDYPVSVGMLERRVAETLGQVDATLDGVATDASVDEKVSAEKTRAEEAEKANADAIAELKGFAVLEVRTDGTTLGPRNNKHVKIEALDNSKNFVERRGILTPTGLTVKVDDRTSGTNDRSLAVFHKDGITIQKNGITNANILKFPNLTEDETIATTSDLDLKLNKSLLGEKDGVAQLDKNGHVPSSQLPSYVDDVLEYTSTSSFPKAGESGKIYVALDTNLTYRWGGSGYVEISPSLALGETNSTAYAGDKGKALEDALAVLTGKVDAANEKLEEVV